MKHILLIGLLLIAIGCTPQEVEEVQEIIEEPDQAVEETEEEQQEEAEEEEQETEEESEEDTAEEQQEEVEEEEQVEEEPEQTFTAPELTNFQIETSCAGTAEITGKVTGDIETIDAVLLENDKLVIYDESNYIEASNWYLATYSDLDKEEYSYKVVATSPDDNEYTLKEGTFEITDCVVIESFSPENNAENLSINTEVVIAFKYEMDKDTVESALSADFTYSTSWSGNTITLDPKDMVYEQDYTVRLDGSAADKDGNQMDNSWDFSFSIGEVPTPVVNKFEMDDLHVNEFSDPQHYEFEIDASDPDDNEPLTYAWAIDCGYFYDGSDLGQSFSGAKKIQWQHANTTDCDDTELTVTITNSESAVNTFKKKILE